MELAQKHNLKSKILGLLLVIVGVYWTLKFLWLFYAYNFTEVLFAFMLPDYVLIINILIGLTIILFGIRTLKKQMKLSRSLLYSISLIAVGIILESTANK
jgi:glucose uptake protein GlcU